MQLLIHYICILQLGLRSQHHEARREVQWIIYESGMFLEQPSDIISRSRAGVLICLLFLKYRMWNCTFIVSYIWCYTIYHWAVHAVSAYIFRSPMTRKTMHPPSTNSTIAHGGHNCGDSGVVRRVKAAAVCVGALSKQCGELTCGTVSPHGPGSMTDWDLVLSNGSFHRESTPLLKTCKHAVDKDPQGETSCSWSINSWVLLIRNFATISAQLWASTASKC